MIRVRLFDEAVKRFAKRGEIAGSAHLSLGQEAEVVGACYALRDDDWMTGNHRSHGHPIGKGSPLGPLMAEIFGKRTGVCKGKGGSMHLADFRVGSLGESGVVGSAVPIATGAAFTAKVLGTDQVSLCFFGDGGANQGVLHESMNLASIWKLPVIYLCENNHYAVTTPASEATSVANIADRAVAYSMPGVTVEDGQDVLAVHRAVDDAVEHARAGGGPSLVEVKTYRYSEHSEGLRHAGVYRPDDEHAYWLSRDPIVRFRGVLSQEHDVDGETLDALEAEVKAEVDEAVKFARDSEFPEPAEAYEDLYSTRVVTPAPTA
ncbi:MAG: pyruvate dehydrogenase (acetyl-transferring) E1 component subunit alpha [Nitriliruptorales bacterium]|nr:pyruvate dehydrogenase (acetyl-transferring) E1 component subunit alpha [Nitriliruptorales bacterium]